ncbi:MAG TPA: MFS transporter [Tepidisphaeraceae bacterium]|nr:MFS transporter [Tepidisphaeraceae bacterium]
MPDPETAPPSPSRPSAALFTLYLIAFVDLLGFGILIPLLPFYALKFEATAVAVALLGSVYSLCQMIGAPVLGMISDRVGRRPVLLISQFGSAVGFVILGIATLVHWPSATIGLGVLFAARVIDGFSGGNIAAVQAYISDITPKADRAKRMGMLGAAFGLSFALGPAIGGLLGVVSPALPAFVAAGCAVSAMALTAIVLPESVRRRSNELDHPAEPVPASDAIDEEAAPPRLAWLSPARLKAVVERPILAMIIGIWFWCMAAFVMMETVFALFAEAQFGLGPRGVGAMFALAGVTIVIVQGGLVGMLAKRFGEWTLVVAGGAIVALAMGMFVLSAETNWLWLIVLAGVVNAAGRSLIGPTLSALVSKESPADRQGAVFGLFNGMGSLARVLGPLLAGYLFIHDIELPFIVAGFVCSGVAIWALMILLHLRRNAPRGFEVAPVDPQTASHA